MCHNVCVVLVYISKHTSFVLGHKIIHKYIIVHMCRHSPCARDPVLNPHHNYILKASENKVLYQLTADSSRTYHEHPRLLNCFCQFSAQTSLHDASLLALTSCTGTEISV